MPRFAKKSVQLSGCACLLDVAFERHFERFAEAHSSDGGSRNAWEPLTAELIARKMGGYAHYRSCDWSSGFPDGHSPVGTECTTDFLFGCHFSLPTDI